MNGAKPRWQAVLSHFGSPARPNPLAEEPLWLRRSAWLSASVWLPASSSLVVLSSKRAPLEWWLRGDQVPSDMGLVHTQSATDPRGLRLLNRAIPSRVPIVFVDDLDPIGIVRYLELRRRCPASVKRRLRFGGVDSTWLAAMRRKLRAHVPLERVLIPLSVREVGLLRLLERAVQLERLVGPTAVAMLQDGSKLEVEGATNPNLFRDGRTPWVFQLLRDAAADGRHRSLGVDELRAR